MEEVYPPAANRFVGDAEPYKFSMNLFVLKRENTVLPYGVSDDFCCFIEKAVFFLLWLPLEGAGCRWQPLSVCSEAPTEAGAEKAEPHGA